MDIAKVIRENRKKKNLTQEQLAELVGVSTSAVSKWESSASLPDLLLIAPIARALSITADELLGFQDELSDEEVTALEQECAEIFRRNGYDAGREKCEALLLEYPNMMYLRFRVAALYQRFLLTIPEHTDARIKQEFDRIYELMQQVYDSGEPRLHAAAAQALASHELMCGALDRAEALLSELPQPEAAPDELYPLLYLKKGERERAVLLLEQLVLRAGMQTIRALHLLSSTAMQDGDSKRALACGQASAALVDALDLQEVTSTMQLLTLLNQYGTKEEAEKTAADYLDRLAVLDYDYSGHPFLCHLAAQPKPEQLPAVKKTLLEGFERAAEYAALREAPSVRASLERLRTVLQPSSTSKNDIA